MEHAAFHLGSAGLNPKAITIWRSFGGIPVMSWVVLSPNDRVLIGGRAPTLAQCLVIPLGSEGQRKGLELVLMPLSLLCIGVSRCSQPPKEQ